MNPKTRPHVQMIVLRSDLNGVGAVGGEVIAAGEPCWSMTSPWESAFAGASTQACLLAQANTSRVTKVFSLEALCAMERCLKEEFAILSPLCRARCRAADAGREATRPCTPHHCGR